MRKETLTFKITCRKVSTLHCLCELCEMFLYGICPAQAVPDDPGSSVNQVPDLWLLGIMCEVRPHELSGGLGKNYSEQQWGLCVLGEH